MTRDQDALLALQDLDTAADRQRHRRVGLPERAELAKLEERLEAARAARREVAGRLAEVAGRQERLEADLAGAEARAAEISRRMASGEAGTGRDITALAASVDHLRSRISDLEDQVLATMEERSPLDEALAAIDSELVEVGERSAALRALIEREEAAIDAELQSLAGQRAAAAADIAAERLAGYERLRARLGGVAVARLVGSRCDGCHLTLPATELDRIKHLPREATVHCDQCGRILVRP